MSALASIPPIGATNRPGPLAAVGTHRLERRIRLQSQSETNPIDEIHATATIAHSMAIVPATVVEAGLPFRYGAQSQWSPGKKADGGYEAGPHIGDEVDEEDRPGTQNHAAGTNSADSMELADEELAAIRELESRDREVRQHEQAHKSVGGRYAGSVSYEYEQGPDGMRYAVSGEVSIDASAESTPEETIAKMRQVQAAALAPAQPSSQDYQVAAQARKRETEAAAAKLRQEAEASSAPIEVESDISGQLSNTSSTSSIGSISGLYGTSTTSTFFDAMTFSSPSAIGRGIDIFA